MRWIRAARLARAAALVAGLYAVAAGHVGSRNVFFAGEAGPYPVSVVIRPPEVIPGLAGISVRVPGGGVDRVTVRPVRWDAVPEGGAPPPDEATPVAGDPELYAAELWFMTVGAYRVEVAVEGSRGSGMVPVPVTSVMLGVLDLPPGLGWVLFALALLLVAGVVSITGAAVRESQIPAGETVGPRQLRRARIAMVATAVGLAGVIYLGNQWWEAVDRDIRSGIFERLAVEGAIVQDGSTAALEIAITDPAWRGRGWSPLVPDHGKLMHLFVVGAPGMAAFAHLHPVLVDSSTFRVAWPDLPPGEYRIYGDIVQESGFAQTVVDTVTVDEAVLGLTVAPEGPVAGNRSVADGVPSRVRAPAGLLPDPDDSDWTGVPVAVSGPRTEVPLADGSTLQWRGDEELRVDEETVLTFRVWSPDGKPVELEPYMGMLSHAAVTRDDGAVFVHLHPAGTISMGSLSVLSPDGSTMAVAGRDAPTGVVEFPFAFPQPGEYTIWVQVKHDDRVLTGAFRTRVLE